jgi:hypothetical protein
MSAGNSTSEDQTKTVLYWAGESKREGEIAKQLEDAGFIVQRRLAEGFEPVAQFHGTYSVGVRNISNDFELGGSAPVHRASTGG